MSLPPAVDYEDAAMRVNPGAVSDDSMQAKRDSRIKTCLLFVVRLTLGRYFESV